ncbi:hypothetical protein V5O48_015869 [Marasmius crinis-equi]|uniref:O-methyltransferase n=1 Tax=Marasmius crinis-equi TaxID=585013 RepID=A0ABR3ETD3_9AGAR
MSSSDASTWQIPHETYTPEAWAREDKYQCSFLVPKDDALDFAVQNSTEKGLPAISVSPAQGKFMYLISKSINAKRILEIGTLGGHSALWLARSLPADGELITLELKEKHAQVARENFDNAGKDVSGRIKIIVGSASESLAQLKPDPQPFDLVFIDADTANLPTYYKEAKRLVRSGGVILIDNMIGAWNGFPSDPANNDSETQKIREVLQLLKDDTEAEATTIPYADRRGYDGFTYIVRK